MQIKLHQQIYRKRLVKEVKSFLEKCKLRTGDCFVIIYGSFVTGDLSVKSDLDIMMVTEKFYNKDYQVFKKFVIEIHKKYKLLVDIEIPYLNKLVVTYKSTGEADRYPFS